LHRPGIVAAVPRAEYPQPHFERAQWLSLNGTWDFDFDDGNLGTQENWLHPSISFADPLSCHIVLKAASAAWETPRFNRTSGIAADFRCRPTGTDAAYCCISVR
jgi:hypothetical protein